VLPDKDILLYYALSDKEFGMTVLTRRQGDQDGFFLVRIAPPAKTVTADVLPKDIAFVIDTSGSMAGEKMRQAREALKFCLANLNREDRFNVVPFSHEALRFRDALVPASPENVEAARKFTDDLRGTGGTNINDALLAALEAGPGPDAGRPYLIVFLTDGQPTIGVTNTEEILSNVAAKNTGRVRLFVFGVGHNVNTILLDSLAERNRGARDYVDPNEDLELKLSSFYRKVSDPVLADLGLSFGGLSVYDMYPPKLSDLFSGSELVVVGRYKGEGPRAVELTGTRRGKQERFVYEATFPAVSNKHEFLPRLWAARKVGFLLDEIRLHGENKELKDTVVHLATKYGIVTPYTAILVTEPGSIVMREGASPLFSQAVRPYLDSESRNAALEGWPDGSPARKRKISGPDAVAESESIAALKAPDYYAALERADAQELGEERKLVERVGTRTFYRVDDRWVDEAYDKTKDITKVESFSVAYFELIRKHPELAKCFALGERVVVVIDGLVYETVPPPAEE
jgi:Ca-activated chloride channel family protein